MTVPVPEKLPLRIAAGGSERNCDAEPEACAHIRPADRPLHRGLDAHEVEHLVALDRPADACRRTRSCCPSSFPGRPAGSSCAPAVLSCVRYSNAEPCSVFVPLLICTFTDAPPAIPCSASKLLVTTLTVSIASMAGVYACRP